LSHKKFTQTFQKNPTKETRLTRRNRGETESFVRERKGVKEEKGEKEDEKKE